MGVLQGAEAALRPGTPHTTRDTRHRFDNAQPMHLPHLDTAHGTADEYKFTSFVFRSGPLRDEIGGRGGGGDHYLTSNKHVMLLEVESVQGIVLLCYSDVDSCAMVEHSCWE